MHRYKAIIGSLLIHILFLYGAGWAIVHSTKATQQQYSAMNLTMSIDEPQPENVPADISTVPENPADAVTDNTVADQQENNYTVKEVVEEQPAELPKTTSTQPQHGSRDVPGQLLPAYSKEQLALALAQYNQVLSLNPSLSTVYGNRGEVFYDKGEFDNALADFDKAISLNPRFVQAYTGRGFIYAKQGQWELSLQNFNKALSLDPQEVLAYYGRALYYSARGEKQKAIDDLETFLQYSSGDQKLIAKVKQRIADLKK